MWYITSDMHLGHEGIIKMCKRPYSNADEMTHDLIKRHNSMVSDSDTIWDLGDLSFREDTSSVVEHLLELNGRRIMILGNHDHAIRDAYKKGYLKGMIRAGKLEIVGDKAAIYDKSLVISKTINHDGYKLFLSHYAVRSWPGAFRGTIMLYGHSHGNLPDLYRSFDVGVDANNWYPWSWDQIKQKIESIPDHFQED